MHRLIVALLATVDAAIAAAVGMAATLAPLTLLWVLGLGGSADWAALWPAAASVWQLGHTVPLAIDLPAEYVAAVGIEPDAAAFVLSLAPLAFAAFTAVFAARSGTRAARADAGVTGVAVGVAVFALAAAGLALTSQTAVSTSELLPAILLPALVYAAPAALGAVVARWRHGETGAIARARERVERDHDWGALPGLIVRGSAAAVIGLVGLGALAVAVAVILGGARMIALYESAHVDALGATVITLGQLAYLPTLIVWAIAFLAGPGFAVGTATSVSPAGTQLGVLPGIPVLGAVPETSSPWLLLLALLPVASGAFAGWIVRSRMVRPPADRGRRRRHDRALEAQPVDPMRREVVGAPALTGLLDADAAAARAAAISAAAIPVAEDAPQSEGDRDGRVAPRLVATAAIAAVAAGAAALFAGMASGSLGPGALSELGPAPGPVALAVGLEVALGAGILLLAPLARTERARAEDRSAPAGTGTAAPVD